MLTRIFCLTAALVLLSSHSLADPGTRPDSHAPIGVMGEHTHKSGEWMLSYRYMRMNMDGNRIDDSRVSDSRVLEDFIATPTQMSMEMHMLGAMYAPNDDLTLMIMLPYVRKEMDHINRMGRRFSTESEGIGDISLSGIYTLYRQQHRQLMLNLGISLPTGSTDERDDTPVRDDAKLPYPMQLGSGTYDLISGLTYRNQFGHYSWGSQVKATLRTGRNDEGYRLGHKYQLNYWLARTLNAQTSISARLSAERVENIRGLDPELNPAFIPTADPDLRAGDTLSLLLGVNLLAPTGYFKGHRLALELGAPLYQNLDGPQLETDFTLTLGWQKAF